MKTKAMRKVKTSGQSLTKATSNKSSSYKNESSLISTAGDNINISWRWCGVAIIVAGLSICIQKRFHLPRGVTRTDKIHVFLKWLKTNGAMISDHVTISEFPQFGGLGLLATTISVECKSKSLIPSCKEPIIHEFDKLFTIPSKLITSVDYLYRRIQSVDPSLLQLYQLKLHQYFESNNNYLVSQDVTIALFHLTFECTLGSSSTYQPYLDILPQDIIPRLDTFTQGDYDTLNDLDLERHGKHSLQILLNFWNDNDVRHVLNQYIHHYSSITPSTTNIPHEISSCTSFANFHRFVSIVSSRAMILNQQKFLTPLAGMINHKPRSSSSLSSTEIISSSPLHTDHNNNSQNHLTSYQTYHQRNPDGSITIQADRDFYYHDQIFEDYGFDLDNTLFLESFGFIPLENPYHCANLSGIMILPSPADLVSQGMKFLLEALDILPLETYGSSWDFHIQSDLCIRRDGSIHHRNSDPTVIRYLTIATLSKNSQLLEKCIHAINATDNSSHLFSSHNHHDVNLHCLQYPDKDELLLKEVQDLASRKYCQQMSSWEEDSLQLDSLREHGNISIQKDLALQFRIEEKRILSQVGDINYTKC